jgi:AAA+ ATPase superfamily predicted ATPase
MLIAWGQIMAWGFYGRNEELQSVSNIFARNRWFFAKISGRRRIGKTTLIQQALRNVGGRPVYYVQIPDSGPAGVMSAVGDALENFRIPNEKFPRPRTLAEIAKLINSLARSGYVAVLDEFQYFNRKTLSPFCSFLQAEVDELSAHADEVHGGLVVLGSIHTEMMALLQDRSAPLYNRTTDDITLSHLDVASILEMLREHADVTPERLLFLWTLFEGVPKFYRDCYEQGVISANRKDLLKKVFFESSSPLRTEADNWFLHELHGRYDVVLKFVARHGGSQHNELISHIQELSGESSEQVSGYLKVLIERYELIEKKLPIFAAPHARRTRYYLADNFLKAWLAALANCVAALNFRPIEELIADADERLCDVEGSGLEKLVSHLYEERNRKGVSGFNLTRRIEGYWDRAGTEIDLVAINERDSIIRFGSCKRSADKLMADTAIFDGHIERFLGVFPIYNDWKIERVSIAPSIPTNMKKSLIEQGRLVQDLVDLTVDL